MLRVNEVLGSFCPSVEYITTLNAESPIHLSYPGCVAKGGGDFFGDHLNVMYYILSIINDTL